MTKIDLKLVEVERRAKLFDYVSVLAPFAISLIVAITVYFSGLLAVTPLVNGVLSALVGIVVGFELAKVFNKYGKLHWFPAYYIDVQPDVLRVVGSVGLGDGEFEFVKAELIRMRPEYRIENDAYAKFGCTMAAVSVSQE